MSKEFGKWGMCGGTAVYPITAVTIKPDLSGLLWSGLSVKENLIGLTQEAITAHPLRMSEIMSHTGRIHNQGLSRPISQPNNIANKGELEAAEQFAR